MAPCATDQLLGMNPFPFAAQIRPVRAETREPELPKVPCSLGSSSDEGVPSREGPSDGEARELGGYPDSGVRQGRRGEGRGFGQEARSHGEVEGDVRRGSRLDVLLQQGEQRIHKAPLSILYLFERLVADPRARVESRTRCAPLFRRGARPHNLPLPAPKDVFIHCLTPLGENARSSQVSP